VSSGLTHAAIFQLLMSRTLNANMMNLVTKFHCAGEDDMAWWNEKFTFEHPLSDWKNLTHLKFKIMDTEFLTDGGFVGETM
jgi:hypothetical protein